MQNLGMILVKVVSITITCIQRYFYQGHCLRIKNTFILQLNDLIILFITL